MDGGAAIDRAGFGPPDIVFLIDGASPTSLDHGHLTFSELATRDTISILFHDIGFSGIVEDRLFVTVGLPTSTFTFTNPIEAPPLFPPTLTVTAGGTGGDGSSYATFTDVGVLVTATRIPEPSTLLLLLSGAALLMFVQRKQTNQKKS